VRRIKVELPEKRGSANAEYFLEIPLPFRRLLRISFGDHAVCLYEVSIFARLSSTDATEPFLAIPARLEKN